VGRVGWATVHLIAAAHRVQQERAEVEMHGTLSVHSQQLQRRQMTGRVLVLVPRPVRVLVRQVREKVSLLAKVMVMTMLTTPLSAPSRVSDRPSYTFPLAFTDTSIEYRVSQSTALRPAGRQDYGMTRTHGSCSSR
jgi:hypothetical protein